MSASSVPHRSIKSLYRLALAESEGAGTAYEYYAKRSILLPWLRRFPTVQRLLIAGLPEKYGSSLDFILLAEDLGATEVVVLDDRSPALEKCRHNHARAQEQGLLGRVLSRFILVTQLARFPDDIGSFEIALSSEVLQRLSAADSQKYLDSLTNLTSGLALFAPNAANEHHAALSELKGLSLDELVLRVAKSFAVKSSGYVDMPPWPPGMTRSGAQRDRAVHGQLEGAAMWGLEQCGRLEKYFPATWRKRRSHIVDALSRTIAVAPL
jgi:hypothetical protein